MQQCSSLSPNSTNIMLKPLEFTLAIDDFVKFLLPEGDAQVGSDRFKIAVGRFYAEQFEPLGGEVIVAVDDKKIHVQWIPNEVAKDPFGYVIDLLQHGEYDEAVPLLQTFLAANPDDVDTLYNLGMALSDLGDLEEAKRHLSRLVELAPHHTNGVVALGVAQQRSGETQKAVSTLRQAVKLDPDNGYAQRNLGGVLLHLRVIDEAEAHLREAYRLLPKDQMAIFGLAQSLQASREEDKLAEADALYVEAIKLDHNPQITEMAKRARSELAQRSFRGSATSGIRMDAVMYCLSALQQFAKMKPQEVQGVAFEIAMLGMNGLDTNDSTQKYKLRSLPGSYSGLQLVSMMYVGFKQIEPSMDAGFDLSKEYEMAQQLFSGGRGS